MAALFLLVWLIPAAWGGFSGYWRAARPALNASDFATDIGIATMTAAAPIFMFHMVWDLVSAHGHRLYLAGHENQKCGA